MGSLSYVPASVPAVAHQCVEDGSEGDVIGVTTPTPKSNSQLHSISPSSEGSNNVMSAQQHNPACVEDAAHRSDKAASGAHSHVSGRVCSSPSEGTSGCILHDQSTCITASDYQPHIPPIETYRVVPTPAVLISSPPALPYLPAISALIGPETPAYAPYIGVGRPVPTQPVTSANAAHVPSTPLLHQGDAF